MQSEDEVLPSGEMESLGQLEQEAEPEALLYVPAVQSSTVHGPPSGPLEPALHLHALLLVLPEGEVESEGQLVQSDSEVAPTVAWYLPAWQLSHAVLTPAALNLPASQLSHAILTPAAALNLPAWQLSQSAGPKSALNLPAGH